MPLNVVVLLVALVGATLIGFAIRRYNGHFRGAARADDETAAVARDHEAVREALRREDVPGGEFGETATLLQFSSAFCAPCRVTRRILGEVAALVPGVTHVEIDAEHHLELVR
ncbi:MAG: thioredoxin family protein, partial [Nocardioidaceae bacterium]